MVVGMPAGGSYNRRELERVMQPHPESRVLESVFIEMDPILDGFAGVLAELRYTGEEYQVNLTAAGSGNQLLRFISGDPAQAYRLLGEELQ